MTLNNLLLGLFETDQLSSSHEKFPKNRILASKNFKISPSAISQRTVVAVLKKLASAPLFLYGINNRFVTGQNLMLDGGQYPGLF